jgi:hypothetical protein
VFGLFVLWGSRLGMLGWMGMALAVYAWGWSVVGASVGGEEAVCAYFAQREWPRLCAPRFAASLPLSQRMEMRVLGRIITSGR